MASWSKRAWIEEFGPDHIWEVYGATEGLVRTWIGGRESLERPGSVGRPTGGARIRIQSPDGAELPSGEEGEIFAMPPGRAGSSYRYIGAERRATVRWGGIGWGTLGHLDADGCVYLADRRADLVITGGVNVWPAEVEAALLAHPAVRSCAVVGVPDDVIAASASTRSSRAGSPPSGSTICALSSPAPVREKHPRSLTSGGPGSGTV